MTAAAPHVWRHHEPTWPDLDAGGVDRAAPDVVVVGAGPTGLVIAAGLGRAGVRTLVLESDSTVCRSSRANAISERTFEVIDRVAPGLGARLLSGSVPMAGGESYFGHRLLSRQITPTADQTGGRYPPTSYLSQWAIESALVEELQARGGPAELRWQSEVTGVEQDATACTLTVSTPAGRYRVRAPWVVAADGGRSAIRRALGLRMHGSADEVTFVVVDAVVEGPQPPPVRRVWFDPSFLRGGLVLRHMPPEGIWRLDFQLPIGSDLDAAVEPDNIERLIRAHLADIGHPATAVRPVQIGTYRTRSVVLDELRHGRVLFAGDAAHLVPIFGGFGLNSGIDDAANLEWKLARVVQGQADESLLDSYSAERVPVVRRTLEFVARATEFMTPSSPASEQLRVAALSLAAQGNELAAGLARHRPFRPFDCASPIVAADDPALCGGPPPGRRVDGAASGADGRRVYLPELLGGALTLLIVAADDRSPAEPLVELARRASDAAAVTARVEFLSGGVGSWTGPGGAAVYLVRPDCVVAARWADPTLEQLTAALRRAVGAPAERDGSPA